MEENKNWIVVLTAKAAFRFSEDKTFTLRTELDNDSGIACVRLRNNKCWVSEDHSDDAPIFYGGFVAEAAGSFTSSQQAVSVLANLANPFFQQLSTLANAGVEEPEDLILYSPPSGKSEKGSWVFQRHSHSRAPALMLRKLPTESVKDFFELFANHPRRDRILRAMAHFRIALNHLDPINRVQSAESLWVVVENLSHVVLERLRSDRGFPQNGEGKHLLAIEMGFNPKLLEAHSWIVRILLRLGLLSQKQLRRDNSHLTSLDRHIRKDIIFGGDEACYKQLKSMSDGFEHGFMGFDEIHEKSKIADRAFILLRKAILREVGLDELHHFFDAKFDEPIGTWRPVLQTEGSYSDSAGRVVDYTPENITNPWPDPPGLSLVPTVRQIVDHPDGKRTLSLQVNGKGNALTPTQSATVEKSLWLSPSGKEAKVIDEKVTARLNGEVIEDSITNGPDIDE